MKNEGTNLELAKEAGKTGDDRRQHLLAGLPSAVVQKELVHNPELAEDLTAEELRIKKATGEKAAEAVAPLKLNNL